MYSKFRSFVPVAALGLVWMRYAHQKLAVSGQGLLSSTESVRHLLMAATVIGLWNIWLSLSPYEKTSPRKDVVAEFARLGYTSAACGTSLFLWGIAGHSIDHGVSLAFASFLVLCLLSTCNLLLFGAATAVSPHVRKKRVAILVGTGRRAAILRDNLVSHASTIELYGCVDDECVPGGLQGLPYLGTIDALADLLKVHPVEMVLIGLPLRSKYDAIQRTIEICESVGVESHYMVSIFETERLHMRTHAQSPENFSVLSHFSPKPSQAIKRLIDVVGASVLLAFFSPVMIAAAVAIRVTSAGPVFFVQERYGLHRKRFPMFKFRSMVVDAELRQATFESQNEAQGPVFKLKKDPRTTRVGAFLRKTSIDELPQLFNVLRGEMSLVGPRPLPHRDVSRFEESWLLRRFSVRPGLTCIWQVSGRSNTAFESWIKQDLEYIDHWSLSLDTQILFRTIPAVLRGVGAA